MDISNIKYEKEVCEIIYEMVFENEEIKTHKIKLDMETYDIILDEERSFPEWTTLEYYKCPVCPLKDDEKLCPVAKSICSLVEDFTESFSYDKVDVTVKTSQRDYYKKTTLQESLSSLYGVYMVTSGCPYLDRLRPMVVNHLPFGTPEETTYRMVCMYLASQYFEQREGNIDEIKVDGLVEMLENITSVDIAFSKRLKMVVKNDATINAISILSLFSQLASFSLQLSYLEHIKKIFLKNREKS